MYRLECQIKMHKEVIEDMRKDCECENTKYCPLEILICTNNNNSDRMFEQHKIIEKFKFEESKKEGCDIGWEKAYEIYVNEGYAKIFAEVYQDGMKNKEIYRKMREVIKKINI